MRVKRRFIQNTEFFQYHDTLTEAPITIITTIIFSKETGVFLFFSFCFVFVFCFKYRISFGIRECKKAATKVAEAALESCIKKDKAGGYVADKILTKQAEAVAYVSCRFKGNGLG